MIVWLDPITPSKRKEENGSICVGSYYCRYYSVGVGYLPDLGRLNRIKKLLGNWKFFPTHREILTLEKEEDMPANNGYFRRKGRKEDALKRRLVNIETYQGDVEKASKLKIAESDVVNLNHNISLSKRGW